MPNEQTPSRAADKQDQIVGLPFRVVVVNGKTMLRVETRVWWGTIGADSGTVADLKLKDGDIGTMTFTANGDIHL